MRSIRKAVAKKRGTLYIKNPAAHRLAEQVSERMGVTLSDAVIAALEEKLERDDRSFNRTKVEALCASAQIPYGLNPDTVGALPVLDARTPEGILAYDAFGIPR